MSVNQPEITESNMKPTVKAAAPFDAKSDAEALNKAFKGLGTDEAAVVRVLARRSNRQRGQIAEQFKKMYGKDLVCQLKSELKGAFESLCVAAVTPLPEFFARELHEAMDGIGTNEGVLAEVLATVDNKMIRDINAAYAKMFGKTLEKDIKKDTSGSFENLLVMMCQANRDEGTVVNEAAARADAVKLFNAGEGRLGTDEQTFNTILALRSYPQLRKIFEEYEKLAGHDFEEAVEKEFSGGTEKGMVTLVNAVKDPAKFFSKRAHEAMEGVGTRDRQLIRVVVTRSEVDLGDVMQKFESKYNRAMTDAVRAESAGDYQKMLLALMG